MYFLSPTYLWALLGLLIPIAIHLWSKKEGRTIKVGSVQLLQQSESTKLSAIRLNEIGLLLLRMLLIALLVGILAEPRLKQSQKQTPLVYVIEPSLVTEGSLSAVLDSIQNELPVHLLMDGFPLLNDPAELETNSVETEYWQLAQQLSSLPADSIIVFTKATMAGIKGMRPSIPSYIHFVLVPSEINELRPLLAFSKENLVEIASLKNTQNNMTFNKELVIESDPKLQINTAKDSVFWEDENHVVRLPLRPKPSSHVQLFYTPDYEQDKNYVEAALKAISAHDKIENTYELVQEGEPISGENDLTIWLSNDPLPKIDGKVLQLKEESLRRGIISEMSSVALAKGEENKADHYIITERLNSENVFDEHFTEALFQLLIADASLEKTIQTNNVSVMDAQQFTPLKNNAIASKSERRNIDLAHWFWIFLIPVIVGERLLSNYRKQ